MTTCTTPCAPRSVTPSVCQSHGIGTYPLITPLTAPTTTKNHPQEDLDLYKKANWGRAVSLVLGMLMGDGQGGKAKVRGWVGSVC